MGTIEDDYRARTPASAHVHERAVGPLAGGDTRTSAHHDPYPVTFTHGEGPRLHDVDGNTYLDLNGNFTSLVHGNAYPPIVDQLVGVVAGGTAWAARNQWQVELAELLAQRIDAIEQVRFTNSGTEAAMLAMHLAKATTGRPKILMARHGYHGSHEDTQAGTHATTSKLDLYGGPSGEGHTTLVADFGDIDAFRQVLDDHGGDIAAVLLEPVAGSIGLQPAETDFLVGVQDATRAAGAVFVLDEVVTFRLASGGAQASHAGLAPDLTMLGKVIGGGFPVGAVGGRPDLLALAAAGGPVKHSGTYNGNPVTCAAGVVSVRELTAERIAVMHDRAERLASHLAAAATATGLPVQAKQVGSLIQLSATGATPGALQRTASATIVNLHLAAMVEGVHFTPRGLLALSTVLTDADIDEAGARLQAAMQRVADAARVG